MEKQLFNICMAHTIDQAEIPVVVPEPYAPYIPENWNGYLVLAEAQNLSIKSFEDYAEQLKLRNDWDKVFRLRGKGSIGVYPWDDGSIKLAVEAALGIRAEQTAVSNGALWSQIDENGCNINPSWELQEKSTNLWAELVPVIQPKYIITCGNIAHGVIDRIPLEIWTWRCDHTRWRLPSRTAMSRVSGMFSGKDLLKRYHEVDTVLKKHEEWAKENEYRQNKIFYACHAVSTVLGKN